MALRGVARAQDLGRRLSLKETDTICAKVAVAGASGYAGGEVLRLLTGHPDLEIGPVAAHGSAGTPVTEVLPQLTGYPGLQDRVFVSSDPAAFANVEPLFTTPPHRESGKLAAALPA